MGVDSIAINDGYDSMEHDSTTITLDTAFQTLLYDLYNKDVSVKVKSFLTASLLVGSMCMDRFSWITRKAGT